MQRRGLLSLPAGMLTLPALTGVTPVPPVLDFGPDFKFGVSSSAYQIEGAVHADGRGTGIWDVFCHEPHRISTGDTADIACDHYHRMPEDVALIAGAGLRNYRFSVSWPRLFPNDDITPNEAGFAFYDRLIDHLQAAGIAPWMCLYHWDLPARLQSKGGWTNRDTAMRLAEFSSFVGRRFGDRVTHWMILNEATIQAMCGYGIGSHAPGMRGRSSWLSALHHLNLGQGLAIQALRANNVAGRIGTVASCEPMRPSTPRDEDVAAAAYFDAVWNGSVLQPLFEGSYPALTEDAFAPFCQGNDLANINQKIDLLGINYYSRIYIKSSPDSPLGAFFGANNDKVEFTAMGWPIEPDGLYEIVTHITQRYGAPEIFISENGYATTHDKRPGNGLEDSGRITYLADHLYFLHKSIKAGANVSGYFVWTLLDSFEWNDGMKWHFGLVAVDFETLQRRPKDSYHWYASVVRANAAIPGERAGDTVPL